uniref:lysozyme n=1 Tax=Cristaria plicata TaxID=165446 RepID=I6ZA43_CRIPL|nr:lysozyme 1 [Cristaria plicata]
MEAVKMFFFLVGLLLTFNKCAESFTTVDSIADLDNAAIQTVLSHSVESISSQCLRCICMAESNCRPIGCIMDMGSLSCGYYQIKEPYYEDCGSPGGDWKTCANDYWCATTCVRNYMARYGPNSGCPNTCQTYARIHNGGPNGCKRSSTLAYWRRVQSFEC